MIGTLDSYDGHSATEEKGLFDVLVFHLWRHRRCPKRLLPALLPGVVLAALIATPSTAVALPVFVPSYAGTAYNETHNIKTTMELTEVREVSAGILAGRVIWGPGLIGDGQFEGTVTGNGSLNLVIGSPVGFDRIEFTGEATPSGTLRGSYIVEPGPQLGRWEVSPNVSPTVTITGHPPAETSQQVATFTFAGIAGGAYECSIDAGAWGACESGDSFGPLAPGDHRFEVRELLNGVVGDVASYSWTVDMPRACILKVARARAFAFVHQSKARLVIRYKAYRPAEVTVSYKLKGSRGKLDLGRASAHFRTAGLFRLPRSLSKPETGKLRATESMTVRFRIPAAPDRCNRYYTKQLTLPKKVFGQTVWFQSDSQFTPGR